MKKILNYKQFILNEDLSPDQIRTQSNNEKKFMKKMEELSKDILTENEQDLDHQTNEKLTELIYRVYDKFFFKKANAEGLNDADYQKALGLIETELEKFRNSAAGKKAEEKYLNKLAKQNIGSNADAPMGDGDAADGDAAEEEFPDESEEELPIPPMSF